MIISTHKQSTDTLLFSLHIDIQTFTQNNNYKIDKTHENQCKSVISVQIIPFLMTTRATTPPPATMINCINLLIGGMRVPAHTQGSEVLNFANWEAMLPASLNISTQMTQIKQICTDYL